MFGLVVPQEGIDSNEFCLKPRKMSRKISQPIVRPMYRKDAFFSGETRPDQFVCFYGLGVIYVAEGLDFSQGVVLLLRIKLRLLSKVDLLILDRLKHDLEFKMFLFPRH